VSWYEKKVWGYTQECVKEVSMLQHYMFMSLVLRVEFSI
jgi:hypothetical protein